MEMRPLDIAAEQVVRWLIDQQRSGALDLTLRITRSYVVEDAPRALEGDLDAGDVEDVRDVIVVGVLEAEPPPSRDGWLLRIRVENTIGPRTPVDEPTPEGDEDIDLATFEAEFIASPASGAAFVELETERPLAQSRFQPVLDDDPHVSSPEAAGGVTGAVLAPSWKAASTSSKSRASCPS